MRKNNFVIILLFFLFGVQVQAQVFTPRIVKAPTKSTNAAVQPQYTLTSARVILHTGSDNKEFPSEVTIWLIAKGSGILYWQPGANIRNEMPVNGVNEFGLIRWTGKNPAGLNLADLQKSGLILRILYMPNLFTDAWRIEGISLKMEFRDQNGNLHPTLGTKQIDFNNASGFLNAVDQFFECRADGSFVPITSSILKDASGFN